MNIKINILLSELNEQLNFIDLEIDNPITKYEKAIDISIISNENLKILIQKINFKSDQEEITFFKKIKPQFTSKIIYYNTIFNIEMKKPNGGTKVLKKYYQNELIKLKAFFDSELDFYKYYRSGNIYLDFKYFLRGKYDIKLSLDSYYFEADKTFSTSHDFKVAKLLANDLIQLFLEHKLIMIENKDNNEKSQLKPNVKITWTATKVSLTELLYALHSQGVFNNGAVDLKDIAEYFEDIFEIDLRQYRRTFLEIRTRKTDRSKFITSLNESLIKRMDNADDII